MADLDLDALERLAKDEDRDREELEIVADAFPRVLSRLRAAEERAWELEAEAVKLRVDHASWFMERKELIARHGELADRALVAEHDLRAAERERDEYLAACQATHGVHPSWVTWALQADTLKRELAEARAALAEAERIGCLACRVREENGG